jgi:hypothetical protein
MGTDTPERREAIDQAAASAIEQAFAVQRVHTVVAEIEGELRRIDSMSQTLPPLIERLSSELLQEIDRVIAELASLRDHLRAEHERVRGQVSGYSEKSAAAIASATAISESLTALKAPVRRMMDRPRNTDE